jgi:hypothetical protein
LLASDFTIGRQLNIRSDRAYQLAAELAGRQGKSITRVVEEALVAYRAATEPHGERLARWEAQLEETWKHLNDSNFKIEDLYDPETGLPA